MVKALHSQAAKPPLPLQTDDLEVEMEPLC